MGVMRIVAMTMVGLLAGRTAVAVDKVVSALAADKVNVSISRQYDAERRDFPVVERHAFVILPTEPAADGTKPWLWYAPTFINGHPDASHEWMFKQLLDKGFAIAGVDVGESYGNPEGRAVYTKLFEHLVREYGLARKACLLPQSRGGLMLYNWASENPDKVQCIGGIYTVCDLASYPGPGIACGAYKMTETQLRETLAENNPIDRLESLVKAKIPILHVHGDSDQVVPLDKNAGELVKRYQELGGSSKLIVIPGKGHEVCPEFFQCQPLVDFFLSSSTRNFFGCKFTGNRTDFTGNVGYEFTAEATCAVTALGRSISGDSLRGAHKVTLWSVTDRRELASVVVTPKSTIDTFGFAYEALPQIVKLEKGCTYRITASEEKGGDPFVEVAGIAAHIGVATVRTAVYGVGDAYPASVYGGTDQGYGVATFYVDPASLDAALLEVAVPKPLVTYGVPKPLIRELTSGYLLQYSFMSPIPYCFNDSDRAVLSGWEVDKSGGRWEYGGAFHIDWFKLVDTRANAAVTLKHQVARQTEGKLTLEFRFRLPAAMDGACWQLRDLEQAGVSLVTKGGNLCWETGKVLMPCENNREYGVNVTADIGSKKADVFVDGELKASGLPFVNPIKSIDYVLVKTGDAATGEMFLNPVNLYKGYIVNETFVTCGVGKVPADWDVTGGSVQQFECGTKPDIFSLKLDGQASREIGKWNGKTVFECRFLLPGKVDGVSVDLGGVALERVVPYRPNLWYMVKAVADPEARTAEVCINGKLLPEKITFAKAKKLIQFSGNVWVDDVQVYPWLDYPSDYVPEPKPVAASHILGVQSCNLWREGTSYAGWDYVYPYADKRKPYLGWYDEGNPEVADWEIKWQVEHGIGFELHCWYRPNNAMSNPIKDGVLDQGIIKGLFNARYSNFKKFAIMCTDQGACETNPQDWRENMIPYWIEYFFKDPRYMKVEGKPLLSIYDFGHFLQMFGGDAGARQAIQTLRDEVAKAGFPGLVLMMELRNADPNVMKTMKSIGVDYCYAYTWGTADVNAQRHSNIAQRDVGAAETFGVLPSISMGWDREAWGVHDGGWVLAADYRALLQWTRDELMPSHPADSLGRKIVMLSNWNEFGEGHFMLPNASGGFGYLDAMREVFTPGGTHEDAVPTDQQKKRFNVLSPRD